MEVGQRPFWIDGKQEPSFQEGRRMVVTPVLQDDLCPNRWVVKCDAVDPMKQTVCIFPMWAAGYVKENRQVVILNFKITVFGDAYECDCRSDDTILIFKPVQTGNIGEAFAGVGGWHFGLSHLGGKPIYAVEKDYDTAKAYALTHEFALMNVEEAMSSMKQGMLPKFLMVAGNIEDPRIWMIASHYEIDTWVGSPPCQPWTGAAFQTGMSVHDGCLLPNFIEMAAFTGAITVMVENVARVVRHEHYRVIRKIARESGLPLMLGNVDSCDPLLPVKRRRWMAVFHRNAIDIDPARINLADHMKWPNEIPDIGKQTSLEVADAFHVNISEGEWTKLSIPEESMIYLKDPIFLPKEQKDPNGNDDQDTTFKKRVITSKKIFTALMASYGSQHEIPQQLLLQNGYHGFVVEQDGQFRLASPWEFAASLGFEPKLWLPTDQHKAWKCMGNAVSIAHTALVALRVHFLLKNRSPFHSNIVLPVELVALIRKRVISLSMWKVEQIDDWERLQTITSTVSMEEQDLVQQKKKIGDISPTKCWSQCKPTEIEVDSDHESQIALNSQEVLGGRMLYKTQDIIQEMRYSSHAKTFMKKELIPCVIIHSQGKVAYKTWVEKYITIINIVQTVLPHVLEDMITGTRVESEEGQQVQLTYICKGNMARVLHVEFRQVQGCVLCPNIGLNFKFMYDCTWQAGDICALLSSHFNIRVGQIVILQNEIQLTQQEFLIPSEEHTFVAKLAVYMPDEPFLELHTAPSTGVDKPRCCVTETKQIRFAVKHPLRDTVRTTAILPNMTVSEVLIKLFPDFPRQDLNMIRGDEIIPGDSSVQNLQQEEQQFWIQFAEYHYIPMTPIVVIPSWRPLNLQEATTAQKWWIRSPFSCRIQQRQMPGCWSITQVAASFFLDTNADVTLLCLKDGKIIDPLHTLSDVGPECALSIRVCALPGGAKKDTSIKDKLRRVLVQHGVPDSGADARVEVVMQAIPVNKLSPHEMDDDHSFWNTLKKLASEAKCRLVTHLELKDLQKWKRLNWNQNEDSVSSQGMKDKKTGFSITDLTFHAQHFTADGEEIPLLTKERFGPDQRGITVMTVEEALEAKPEASISPEPLAILAVGPLVHKLGSKLMVPAHNKEHMPVLVPATIVNCGDIQVEFTAATPAATTATIEATTVEVLILREHVVTWDATSTPLHFLGVNVPELRGSGKILSHWGIKTYKKRKQCDFKIADSWHGYMKISDDLLEQVLKRSGIGGIFFTPKDVNKRGDPRFAIVSMPTMKIDEIAKQISSISESLGIAIMGGDNHAFAVRCRKEHSQAVRGILYPESIQVETAAIQPDDKLFTLKYVHDQLTSEHLTEALVQTGWEAKAIKPTGSHSWLVASSQDPPAGHLCINGGLIVVIPVKRSNQPAPLVITRSDQVTQVTAHADGSHTTTRHSRIDELRTDMQQQIANIVDQKMMVAQQQIHELKEALQQTQERMFESQTQQQEQIQTLKGEQEHTQAKLADVENTVKGSTQTILEQMQCMMINMQKENNKQLEGLQNTIKSTSSELKDELEGRITTIEREQNKRAKTGV